MKQCQKCKTVYREDWPYCPICHSEKFLYLQDAPPHKENAGDTCDWCGAQADVIGVAFGADKPGGRLRRAEKGATADRTIYYVCDACGKARSRAPIASVWAAFLACYLICWGLLTACAVRGRWSVQLVGLAALALLLHAWLGYGLVQAARPRNSLWPTLLLFTPASVVYPLLQRRAILRQRRAESALEAYVAAQACVAPDAPATEAIDGQALRRFMQADGGAREESPRE